MSPSAAFLDAKDGRYKCRPYIRPGFASIERPPILLRRRQRRAGPLRLGRRARPQRPAADDRGLRRAALRAADGGDREGVRRLLYQRVLHRRLHPFTSAERAVAARPVRRPRFHRHMSTILQSLPTGEKVGIGGFICYHLCPAIGPRRPSRAAAPSGACSRPS